MTVSRNAVTQFQTMTRPLIMKRKPMCKPTNNCRGLRISSQEHTQIMWIDWGWQRRCYFLVWRAVLGYNILPHVVLGIENTDA